MRTPHLRPTLVLTALVLGAGGCRGVIDSDERDSAACRQTYEFGNHGCARVVALVEAPPPPWPALSRWALHVRSARPQLGAGAVPVREPGPGAVPVEVTLYALPAPGDTASFWIVAKLLEDPRPAQVGVPLPVFAADSVLRVLRFAAVGAVPPVDTVRLTLRR